MRWWQIFCGSLGVTQQWWLSLDGDASVVQCPAAKPWRAACATHGAAAYRTVSLASAAAGANAADSVAHRDAASAGF